MDRCYLCRNSNVNSGKVEVSITIHGAPNKQELWLCEDCIKSLPKTEPLNVISFIRERKTLLTEQNFTCKGCNKIIPINQYPRKLTISWTINSPYHSKEFNEQVTYTLCPSCANKAKQVLEQFKDKGYCITTLCAQLRIPYPCHYDAYNIKAELE